MGNLDHIRWSFVHIYPEYHISTDSTLAKNKQDTSGCATSLFNEILK